MPKILVPIDDSPTARKTLQNIVELKDRFATSLTLLHVIDTDQLAYRMIPDLQVDMVKENATKAGKKFLERAKTDLEKEGFGVDIILKFGEPRYTIAAIANDQAFDLLVIGRHQGGGKIRDVIFGSVANHVLHNVACPVLLF
ncbi:universal stress protein [Desulforhopalus singaporensis]|uniref:Nucleotide-binding universal stress protein, UspA family n=1 Tax=Desulforhopalus singaporensis TaxID=91360 RepID=A0A1H0J0Q9_9BACT|nr:universal stress protein [Desulforhopalus singaporensis]SDO37182.1 Nucleotide-binding universal stress protein, UspA family [Desulforhopalus singaporensis]